MKKVFSFVCVLMSEDLATHITVGQYQGRAKIPRTPFLPSPPADLCLSPIDTLLPTGETMQSSLQVSKLV